MQSTTSVEQAGFSTSEEESRGGCGLALLFAASAAAVLILSLVAQFLLFTVGEMVFYGIQFPDVRWAVELGFGLAVFIPAAVLTAIIKNRFHKRFYRTIMLAGIYCLALMPVHFTGITSAQLANLLQIGASLVFMAGLLIWMKRKNAGPVIHYRPAWPHLLPGLAAGMFSGIFWLARGAFGSPLDILLNFLAALALGFALVFIIQTGLFPEGPEKPLLFSRKDLILYGLAAWLVFLAAGTAFGQNGSQMLLAAVLPWTAWPVAAWLGKPAGEARPWPALTFVSLTAAWPLMLIDPDELSTIINAGPDELIEVAARAGAATIMILIVIALLALARPRINPALAVWLAGLSVAACAAAFLIFGRPGTFGEKLFVVMKSQTDLDRFSEVRDAGRRRDEIYHTLTIDAGKSQAGLKTDLDRMRIPYHSYYLVNGMEVDGGPLLRWWLESRPDVDRVLDSPHLRPLPDEIPTARGDLTAPPANMWNLEMIGVDRVRSEFGITGEGIIVGQSDSGVDGSHPELADSYRGSGGSDDYNWFDPWYGSPSPVDQNGHGTHTLGTILGNRVGIAPDAEWIGCANLRRNLGNPAVYLDCMQFMLAPFPQNGDPFMDGKSELGAHVLNNSWGCPDVEGCDPGVFSQAVKALRAAGVFMVVSAGNTGDGGCGSVADPPAIYAEVLSVGAVNSNRQRTSFSSLGPVTVDGSGRVKPDLMAPGEQVVSSFPENTYAPQDGTSMAGPHVVGVVALMWSANPNLIGDIDRTTEILESTASRMTDLTVSCDNTSSYPNNATGYGIVNAYKAVQAAMNAK